MRSHKLPPSDCIVSEVDLISVTALQYVMSVQFLFLLFIRESVSLTVVHLFPQNLCLDRFGFGLLVNFQCSPHEILYWECGIRTDF